MQICGQIICGNMKREKMMLLEEKYKDRFIEGGVFGGIFVIYLNAFKDPKPEETFFRSLRAMSEELYHAKIGRAHV